jgi:DNA-binding response OmpR family regulator
MGKRKILIVDDEENIRLLYSEELRDRGYEVETAESADQVEQKIREFNPDVITLDIKMPGIDGIEYLRKLREENVQTPVILCSAYSHYKQDFRSWASEAYVVKSSQIDELADTIREILSRRENKGD